MTLYTQAKSNTRKTWVYLTFFFILVMAVGWIISYLTNNQAILWIAFALSIGSSFLSYWQSDKLVLAISGARPIEKADNPELYRLVENLCITAGLPLPKIYIISSPQPNAFATGRDPQHGVVAVTTGLLEKLERIELEGVIGHELSHIGNRDALLSTIVVILAGTITMMTNFFFRVRFRGSDRDDRGGQIRMILMLLGLALVILAPFFATLMKLAISRKREFLADADSALLTRFPDGLIRALEKISADPHPLRTANDATAHLYIVNPFKGKDGLGWFHKLFMTHQVLEERIAALRGLKV